MSRTGRVRGWAVLALAAGLAATPASAQEEASAPFVGVAVGGGEAPAALLDGCGRYDASTASMLADLRVGLPVGPLVLESRTALTGPVNLLGRDDCYLVAPSHPSGIHTDRLRGFDPGSLTASDLRVGYRGASRVPWIAFLGAGWVWSHDLPFLLAGAGLRTPGRLRGAVDVEWNRYHVPFDVVTREWGGTGVVRELSRERERQWRGGWSLRLGAEYDIR